MGHRDANPGTLCPALTSGTSCRDPQGRAERALHDHPPRIAVDSPADGAAIRSVVSVEPRVDGWGLKSVSYRLTGSPWRPFRRLPTSSC